MAKMQKTAEEILTEIDHIAPGIVLRGYLEEMESKRPDEPNWAFHWYEFEENNDVFSRALLTLRGRYPHIDWTGSPTRSGRRFA